MHTLLARGVADRTASAALFTVLVAFLRMFPSAFDVRRAQRSFSSFLQFQVYTTLHTVYTYTPERPRHTAPSTAPFVRALSPTEASTCRARRPERARRRRRRVRDVQPSGMPADDYVDVDDRRDACERLHRTKTRITTTRTTTRRSDGRDRSRV